MQLHLAINSGVVALLEVHALPLHQGSDTLRAVAAPDCRVSHAVNHPPPEVRVVRLNAFDLSRHLCRFPLHTLVWRPRAAVEFPDAVHPPVAINCIPSYREWPGIPPVEAAPDRPVLRNHKRIDDVREPPILIMRRIVAPLREYLTGERIPIPIEQGLPLCVRHRRQPLHILRVVRQQSRVVKHAGRHKDPRLRRAVLCPVRVCPRRILRDRRHRRRRRDKPFLYPRMTNVSGVRRRADINPRPRPIRAVSREQIHIFVVGEVRQLIKCDEVIRLSLILRPVFGVLH